MKRSIIPYSIPGAVFLVLVSAFLMRGCPAGKNPESLSRVSARMGTFLEVKVSSGHMRREELQYILDEAFGLATSLESKFNLYDPASELNELNISGDMEVSPELFHVIRRAKDISRITGGGFDPALAPLLKEAGFYESMPPDLLAKIPPAGPRTGIGDIGLDPVNGRVILGDEVWLDLSGIAKGYVVDRISFHLQERGITDFIVNAGGDIFCGVKENGRRMRIGVREPGADRILFVLELNDRAVATSGDYEKTVIEESTGRELSHIFGSSAREGLLKVPSSFTVIAPDCTTADALSTGMMAMGPQKALVLADSIEGVELIVAGMECEPEKVMFSAGAREYLAER